MKLGSIYIIRNTVNSKVYIWQTTMTVHERFMVHMKPSTAKQRRNYKLYNAVAKYGRDKFYVETLETNIPLELINDKEIEYIAKYDSFYNGYNSTKGGDGRIINKVENEEAVLQMAKTGVQAVEIAEFLHVNPATVLRTLHKLGFRYWPDQDEIVRLADSGTSNAEIAASVGCHAQTVCRVLNRKNQRKHKLPISKRSGFDAQGIIDAYQNQTPIGEICSSFDISRTTFYRIKDQYNIPTRKQLYQTKNNAR